MKFIRFFILIWLFPLYSCSEVGILATIASSKKIEKGSLTDNINIRKIMTITPDAQTAKYHFAVGGTGLYYKDKSNLNNSWSSKPMTLSSDNENWDGIQSVVSTKNAIFMSVYRYNGTTYTVGILRMDSFDGSQPSYTLLDKKWTSTSTSYQTVYLFAPEPEGMIYVNILEYSGEYASLESGKNNFITSDIYKFNPAAVNWESGKSELSNLSKILSENNSAKEAHYVNSISVSGNTPKRTIISAVSKKSGSSSGLLVDENGNNVITDGDLSEGTTLTALAWIPGEGGAFIVAAEKSGKFPLYASRNGSIWTLFEDNAVYKISFFIDISNYTAGSSGSKRFVLAGTSSYISDGVSKAAYGYVEIDVAKENISDWSLNRNRNIYQFANSSNYLSSKLSSSSVNSLTALSYGSNMYLFASTAFEGLWRASLDTLRPEWKKE